MQRCLGDVDLVDFLCACMPAGLLCLALHGVRVRSGPLAAPPWVPKAHHPPHRGVLWPRPPPPTPAAAISAMPIALQPIILFSTLAEINPAVRVRRAARDRSAPGGRGGGGMVLCVTKSRRRPVLCVKKVIKAKFFSSRKVGERSNIEFHRFNIK